MRAAPLVLCLAAAALAGPVEEEADAVLAAGADLKALAAKDDPDPWLVADELIRRGKLDQAEAFARAAPRPDTERLPEYVASRRGKPDDAAARERVSRVNEGLTKKEFQKVLDLADSPRASEDSVSSARLLFAKGLALRSLNHLAESARAFEEAGATSGRVGWVAQQAQSLSQAGRSAYFHGDYPAALRCWTDRAAVEERRANDVGIAGALGNLGIIHQSLGDYPKALLFYERSLLMKEDLGDRAGIARTLCNIGIIHQRLADHARALEFQERALRLMEELDDRPDIANCLCNLGLIHQSLGDYPKALEFSERSLHMSEDLGDRGGIARTLGNLGIIHERLGDHPKALEFQERALRMKEDLGDRQGIAATLTNIGVIHKDLGDYTKALEFCERSRHMMEELGDRAGLAATLANIGNIHQGRGDYPRALEFQERSLGMKEEIHDRAGIARTLGNIGIIHQRLADHARALEFQERALRMMEELGDRADMVDCLCNTGNIYDSLGDYPKALEFQERSLRTSEELGGRAGSARALSNIGSIHDSLGDYPKALEFQERALRMMEELGDREGITGALEKIGIIHGRLGDYPKALEFHERALGLSRELGDRNATALILWGRARALLALGRSPEAIADARAAVGEVSFLVRGLGEEEGARAREDKAGVFETGATAALAVESVADVGFFLEAERAGSLLEGLGNRAAIQGAVLPEKLRTEEAGALAAESVAQKLLQQALNGGDRKEIAERRAALDAARKGLEDVVARIQRTEKAVASVLYPKADSLDEIRGRVREGEALVLYGLLSDQSVALVVTSEKARVVRLAGRKQIDEGKDLAKLLVEPLNLPKEVRRVLVSPTGSLCYVPFCTLFPDREVVYLPSGTTYGVLLDDAKKRGDSVLALGDPDYGGKFDDHELTVLRGGARLSPLPGSRAEAKAVGTSVLLGADATEAGLFKALATKERWHAVHLACHGLIEPERPQLSSLALSGGDFLTVLEVYRSRIPADLVVLSACETAKGKVYRAEGVMGFVRAFMFAGAPRVLVSLWKVDDEATQALMTRFYELWKDRPAARALKEAQDFVRSQEKWKDPKYWAAWQLWGLPE